MIDLFNELLGLLEPHAKLLANADPKHFVATSTPTGTAFTVKLPSGRAFALGNPLRFDIGPGFDEGALDV